jgi:hypothetical protein
VKGNVNDFKMYIFNSILSDASFVYVFEQIIMHGLEQRPDANVACKKMIKIKIAAKFAKRASFTTLYFALSAAYTRISLNKIYIKDI